MHRLTLTTQLLKKPHLTQIRVDQETIILDAIHQTYFSLNVTGEKMWSLFNKEALTPLDLAQYLKKQYRLDEEKSIRDALQFIEQLLANDLVWILGG